MGSGQSKAELADILVTLSKTDVSPEAHEFWDELWKIETDPETIFELIPPSDVRKLKKEHAENFVTLFTQAVAQLCQIVHTPVPMYFGQALNCVRILTRVLPFLLEAEDDFVERLCWSVDDDEEPLARLVVHAAMHLLFLPGFTVEDEDMWAAGVGGLDATPVASTAFDKNRVEVLRLLLATVCEPLFQTADDFDPKRSRWLAVACHKEAPNSQLLLYSLLNAVLGYDPTGFGVPYGGALASEAPTQLASVAAQVAIALLDYGGDNNFRTLLASITEYDFMFEGFARLLNNVHEALNTALPGSLAQIDCYQEVLVLLWKMMEENAGFMPHLLHHCDVTRLVVPICFLQYQARRDPARVGLVHICTFVLLKVSGERPFCVALNKPFTESLPLGDLPLFEGSHADLIVVTLHKLVVNGGDKLAALYNCFLTIICNLSPYSKSLSLVASVKLVNLFELFTSPRFLYQAEANHVYVALLLEIFNNIIQYQYGGNPHLVYAIVRRKAVFESLDKLTLPTAIAHAKSVDDEPTTNGERIRDKQQQVPRFTPTQEWLARVKADLPLSTISRLLQHLGPQLDELVAQAEFALDDTHILDFIKNTTMVGLLPVPHPIVIRKYQPNNFTALWFTAYLWGVIFLQNQLVPLFDGAAIKLFTVSVVN